jgi:hypothetical protein
MGMDSYIYKFNKNDYNIHLENKKKYKNLEDEYLLFYNTLEKKYGVEKTIDDLAKLLSEDEKQIAHNFSKRFEELNTKSNYPEEIFYWRKPYKLHDFIIKNFLPTGEDDNCNHIKLSKENINLIIDKLKNDPSYFDNNMWCYDDTEYALKIFSQIYDNYSDDDVYTYYSWY